MDEFKIRSIDEFDADFVAKLNESNNITSVSSNGLIPEIPKTVDSEITDAPVIVENPENEAVYAEVPDQEIPEIIEDDSEEIIITPTANTYEPEYDDADYDDESTKSSKGALVGKIISIILLASTIVVFVLGCFITVFLDNEGAQIGGTCFNTVSADVIDNDGKKYFSKGDLIISRKLEANEYVSGQLLAVKSRSIQERCDIMYIDSVQASYGDNTQLVVTNRTDGTLSFETISSTDSYGVVTRYFPSLGGIIHFAMDNAILVCVLFVLLAAMWCLILVLIDNQKNKKKKSK